jgi:excisionase family DNA binding protein
MQHFDRFRSLVARWLALLALLCGPLLLGFASLFTRTDAPTEQQLMSPAELAAYLAVPLKTIYKWQSQTPRYGPRYLRVGRHVRYRRADVDTWLDTLEVVER